MGRPGMPDTDDRAWYHVTLVKRPDDMSRPLVIYARAFTATHTECRVGDLGRFAPLVLPRAMLIKLAYSWEQVNDAQLIQSLNG